MKFSEKIQKTPLGVRKIILWVIVVFLGILLIYFWTKISIQRFHQVWKPEELSREMKIPSLKEKIQEGTPEFKKLESFLNTLSSPRSPKGINLPTSSLPNF